MIEVVSATRHSEADFWTKSALGWSLKRLRPEGRVRPHIAHSNTRGVPEVYNGRIAAESEADHLVFLHDDVWIDDFFLADRVVEGLNHFDVIGVAGNKRRAPHQLAWPCKPGELAWDDMANLSGSIATGKHPFGPVSYFGPAPAECELLDGVFLAARRSALRAKGVLFDPQFDFHFYDMDFCRTVRSLGLKLGTWPICLTHQSNGKFGSPPWAEKYERYLEKWKE